MELSRYWRVLHEGHRVEVEWTGLRFRQGWTLRLRVDGHLQAESPLGRWGAGSLQGTAGNDAISVRFVSRFLRSHCVISAGQKVLEDSTRPWNALAFFIMGLPLALQLVRIFLR